MDISLWKGTISRHSFCFVAFNNIYGMRYLYILNNVSIYLSYDNIYIIKICKSGSLSFNGGIYFLKKML